MTEGGFWNGRERYTHTQARAARTLPGQLEDAVGQDQKRKKRKENVRVTKQSFFSCCRLGRVFISICRLGEMAAALKST